MGFLGKSIEKNDCRCQVLPEKNQAILREAFLGEFMRTQNLPQFPWGTMERVGQDGKSAMTRALQKPDLLAPAGNWDCAKAAVENGADALYFGLDRFNARMRADNFTEADLPELMAFLHGRGVKGYVTFNTLVFPAELPAAEAYLRKIIAAGVDAAIAQDVGICRLIRHLSSDFPIHASTQMTVTSAAGVAFARNLGCQLVVLARECSLKEIEKIQAQSQASDLSLPLEVFVHGALCVSYSGQCLTSEALGGRSANRGECAQACRMTYDLIADGKTIDLGDRQYLLSPQDLAGIDVLPELVRSGVSCLKVEGRLKTPEYVANVTRTYRQAIDRAFTDATARPTSQERYDLEMGFSRGLYTGWFQGIDNQTLVHARFAKKRGVYLGQVEKVKGDRVFATLESPLKPGDGVVFVGREERGGRVYGVEEDGDRAALTFGKGSLDLRQIRSGDELWKTSDPELDRRLRKTFNQENPQYQREISLEVSGSVGEVLMISARDEFGYQARVQSEMPLEAARNRPLTAEQLRDKLGRLGNTPFVLGELKNEIVGDVILPVSELNRLRREFVAKLEQLRGDRSTGLGQLQPWQLRSPVSYRDLLPPREETFPQEASNLVVLVRDRNQLEAALQANIQTIYCELEDPRAYREMVAIARAGNAELWVAPPRITKPLENYILEQVRRSEADGYLVRNYDQLEYFKGDRCRGDFSLNFANPIAANYFHQEFKLETLTASYDLNIAQLTNLLQTSPPSWWEIVIHQHMPMFHMEHCVFCAFLSEGKDFKDCGRPCEEYEVKLRDRVGTEHVLQADAGCRNTVFNGTAQTGAESVQYLQDLGARTFRVEFLDESKAKTAKTIAYYQQLLRGEIDGAQLWRALKLQNQLGVTRGSLESSPKPLV